MKKSSIFIFLILFALNLQAVTLLDLGFQTRAVGMGNAFSALCDDSSTIYYNPALLYHIEKHQVSIGYSHLFLTANNFNLSYIYPKLLLKPDVGVSIGISSLFDSDIKTYLPVSYGEPGDYTTGDNFNFYENLFIIGGGAKIKNIWMMQISGGVSIKYFNRGLENIKSNGFGFDIGVNVKHKLFNFAIVIKNILGRLYSESKISSSDIKEDIPITLRTGTLLRIKRIIRKIFKPVEKRPSVDSFNRSSQYLNYEINPVIDTEFVFDKKFRFNIFTGIEGWLNNLIALRCGYNNLQGLSCGGSVNISQIRVDYSYSIHSELEGTHKITGTYYF